jgi:hypothetical protein
MWCKIVKWVKCRHLFVDLFYKCVESWMLSFMEAVYVFNESQHSAARVCVFCWLSVLIPIFLSLYGQGQRHLYLLPAYKSTTHVSIPASLLSVFSKFNTQNSLHFVSNYLVTPNFQMTNQGKNSRVTVGVWKWFGQRLPFRQITSCEIAPIIVGWCGLSRLRLKCDGTRAETRLRLSAKRTSPFKSAGASVQSTTGRISGSNTGYTMFRGSVKSTGYPLHSPVFPSLPHPCVTVCHHISTGPYTTFHHQMAQVVPVKSRYIITNSRRQGASKDSLRIECDDHGQRRTVVPVERRR